jgi:hypothetical protein
LLRTSTLAYIAILFTAACVGCSAIEYRFSHRRISDGDITRLHKQLMRENSTLRRNEHYSFQRIYCQDGMAVSFEFDPYEKSDSHIRYWVSQCNRDGFSWECDAPVQVTKVLAPEYPMGVRVSDDLRLEDARVVISRWALFKRVDVPASISLYSPEFREELDAIFGSSQAHETADCTHLVVTENGAFLCIDLQCPECSPIHLFGPLSTNLECWPSSD